MRHLAIVALCATAIGSVTPAAALSINGFVVFGDSNVDIGRAAAELAGDPDDGVVVPPNTVDGRSADGTILPEFLADRVGVPQRNYGWGGAQAGPDNILGILPLGAPDTLKTGTLSQLDEFDAFLGGSPADDAALYLVFAGSNDLFFANKDNQAEVDAAVASADANLRTAVTRLSDAGAQNIVVATRTPRPVLSDAATVTEEANPDARNDAAGRQLNTAIATLVTDLDSALSSNVLLFDAYALIREIIAGSGSNGFDLYSDAPADYCNPPTGPQKPDCATLINFDNAHKTSAVHSVLADRFITQFDLQAAPAPVPLPAAGWMLIAALGGIGALRLRKAA
jgi:phospholipase/lecithinase/hemolysin